MNNRIAAMFKFGVVGLLNSGVDFTVFTFLTLCNVPLMASQCVSYACGVTNSFVLNRIWTFQYRGRYAGQLVKFIVVNLITMLLTYGLLAAFHQYMGWPTLFSKLAATGISLIFNFAGSRLWVFRDAISTNQNLRYNGRSAQ